jgi:hypothetical protein
MMLPRDRIVVCACVVACSVCLMACLVAYGARRSRERDVAAIVEAVSAVCASFAESGLSVHVAVGSGGEKE